MTLRAGRAVMLLVPASLYFFSYFHRVAPAVVATDLMRAFSTSAASLALLGAIYPWVFVVMALVAGSLSDGIGPRWTLALGGVAMAFGAALFGLAPTFGVAFVARMLVGLGASVILIAWLSLVAAWFRPDQFATVSGATQAVGNVGALAAASPLALLVDAAGWRQTFLWIGTLTLLLALVAVLTLRDRPEHAGLPPVNPAPARGATSVADTLASAWSVIGNPRSWPPMLASGGMFWTAVTLQGLWGVAWLTQVYGLTRLQAATSLSAIALGFAVGSPLAGWLSDRWLQRRRLPLLVFTATYALCWVPLVLPLGREAVGSLTPLFFVMGVAGGGLSLIWACVREVNDPARVGVAVGFCNVPIFLGFALVQWVTGLVLDARWQGLVSAGARVYPPDAYRAVFAVCLVVAVGAVVAATRVTETRCANVWRSPAI